MQKEEGICGAHSPGVTRGPPRQLLHIFPTFAIGGSQSRFLQLIKAHGDAYFHTIVALDGCYDMAARIPDGAPIAYLDAKIGKQDGLATILKIRNVLAAARPDVLVTYNWGAIEWAFVNRLFRFASHVHIEDGFGPEEQERQFRRRIFLRHLALGGRRTVIVLPSRALVRIATQQWRLPTRSLRYIPNGIDCARFDASRNKMEQGGPLIVGTVASLRPEKNLTRLIHSFAMARADRPEVDLRLLIVGDGRERDKLQEAARRVGCATTVTFVGATDKPEHFFCQMAIFAMSSDTEQMPLTVLEAMANGLPIVSTDVGDIAEMVSPDNRPYVTKLKDEQGLRRSLVTLIDNAAARNELGQLNREKAFAHFDFPQMAFKYSELFN